jgi:hypothetical protein
MNKKVIIALGIVLVVAVLGVVAFFVMRQANNVPTTALSETNFVQVSGGEEVVSCEYEAKICPDGNIVVRDATNGCEFYECPVDPTNPQTQTTGN